MKTIRTLTPEVRIIDRAKGTVDYVASDPTLDSYSEIIDPRGWRFSRFEKNSPFVDSHDYYCIDKLLGRVTDFRIEGKALVERVQWAIDVPENALAQLGWKMTLGGYLRAVSVGFVPVRYVSKWRHTPAEMADAVKELGLDAATAAQVCCIYLEQEQLELSACIIGANPNALAKAHKDGAVGDGDLAACGFDDDAMQDLHDFAGSIEREPQRAAELRAIWRRLAHLISTGTHPKPATSAPGRAAAEGARQRTRSAILSELKQLTQTITNH